MFRKEGLTGCDVQGEYFTISNLFELLYTRCGNVTESSTEPFLNNWTVASVLLGCRDCSTVVFIRRASRAAISVVEEPQSSVCNHIRQT